MDQNTPILHHDDSRCFAFDIASAPGDLHQFDIYLQHENTSKPTLYTAKGNGLSESDIARLVRQGVNRIYAPVEQHHIYRAIILEQLDTCFHDDDLTSEERCLCIRNKILDILREALQPSQGPEPFFTIFDLGTQLTRWINANEERFISLIDLSEFRFNTLEHLYNTGIYTGTLAFGIHNNDHDLQADAFVGGFLHDIALQDTPPQILTKQGSLSSEEWLDVHAHPIRGYNLLKDCPGVTESVLASIHDHHERIDGGGYPRGISGDAIHPIPQLLAITDTFDTICAAQTKRPCMHPLDAINAMREGFGAQFAPQPFALWKQLVESCTQDYPARIGIPRDQEGKYPRDGLMSKLLQSGPRGMPPYAPPVRSTESQFWLDERRIAQRKPYLTTLKAVVHHQGKSSSARIGEEVLLQTVDVSVTGIQAITPWPFSQGDVYMLHLPRPAGKTILQRARVVRVREREDGLWIAGMQFLHNAQMPVHNQNVA